MSQLDRVIEELNKVSSSMKYILKDKLKLTDAGIERHILLLERAGYIYVFGQEIIRIKDIPQGNPYLFFKEQSLSPSYFKDKLELVTISNGRLATLSIIELLNWLFYNNIYPKTIDDYTTYSSLHTSQLANYLNSFVRAGYFAKDTDEWDNITYTQHTLLPNGIPAKRIEFEAINNRATNYIPTSNKIIGREDYRFAAEEFAAGMTWLCEWEKEICIKALMDALMWGE